MAAVIYGLCAATSLLCAFLLLRSYSGSNNRLLLWGGLCFCGLTLSNAILVVDKLLVPHIDLSPWRYGLTLVSLLIFLYGLVWDSQP